MKYKHVKYIELCFILYHLFTIFLYVKFISIIQIDFYESILLHKYILYNMQYYRNITIEKVLRTA
jgi:hypothetical protein